VTFLVVYEVARYEGKSDLNNCTQVDKGILVLINVTGEYEGSTLKLLISQCHLYSDHKTIFPLF